jgi:predicted ester cyclase
LVEQLIRNQQVIGSSPIFGSIPHRAYPSPPRLIANCCRKTRSRKTDEFQKGNQHVTKDEIRNLATAWIAAWNAHDLDSIMSHYEDAVELTSPVAAQLLGIPAGKVVGKPNLRAYFARGLAAYPELYFHLEDVLSGVTTLVLYYKNQKGTRTGEFMELSPTGKIARVVAHYSV